MGGKWSGIRKYEEVVLLINLTISTLIFAS